MLYGKAFKATTRLPDDEANAMYPIADPTPASARTCETVESPPFLAEREGEAMDLKSAWQRWREFVDRVSSSVTRLATVPRLRRAQRQSAALGLACLILTGACFGSAHAEVSAADHRFMDDAAAGGMAEIVLGRVAQEKATSDAVKQFGAHMVEDHSQANEELKAIAAAKGAQLPTGLSSDQKAMVSHMKKQKGANFDRLYMARMLDDHRKTVALFERATVGAGDADVKAYAVKTLPILRSHLELAQQTNSGLNTAAGKAGGKGAAKPASRE